MACSDHSHAAVDELVHAACVESDVEEHLRRDAVAILSSYLELDIFVDLILISDPKGFLVIHAVQQFLQQALVVEVQVEFQHVKDDDDVDLVEEGEDDGAEQVEYAIFIGDCEIAEDGAGFVGNPQHEHNHWLHHVLNDPAGSIDDQLKFPTLKLVLFLLLLLTLWRSLVLHL